MRKGETLFSSIKDLLVARSQPGNSGCILKKEFGISESHLMRIMNGTSWSHVVPAKSIVEIRDRLPQTGKNNPNYRHGRRVARSVSDVWEALGG